MRPAFFVLLLALAGVVLSPACGRAEIVIATAGPLTGHNIFRGEQIREGAEMWVADIDAGGGELGQFLELLIAEDVLGRVGFDDKGDIAAPGSLVLRAWPHV